VAPGWPRLAAQTTTPPNCRQPAPTSAATRCQPRLAYDFVFDSCANGQQLKCLTVVDEFTHECLATDVAGSIRSGRVIDVLTRR
jgi:putative transposase